MAFGNDSPPAVVPTGEERAGKGNIFEGAQKTADVIQRTILTCVW